MRARLGTAPRSHARAKPRAEQTFKNIIEWEIRKSRVKVPAHPRLAETVIRRPLIRVRENLIRLVNFLETSMRVRFFIDIRMILPRQFVKLPLELVRRSRARHPKNFVVISRASHSFFILLGFRFTNSEQQLYAILPLCQP